MLGKQPRHHRLHLQQAQPAGLGHLGALVWGYTYGGLEQLAIRTLTTGGSFWWRFRHRYAEPAGSADDPRAAASSGNGSRRAQQKYHPLHSRHLRQPRPSPGQAKSPRRAAAGRPAPPVRCASTSGCPRPASRRLLRRRPRSRVRSPSSRTWKRHRLCCGPQA